MSLHNNLFLLQDLLLDVKTFTAEIMESSVRRELGVNWLKAGTKKSREIRG
jgi:hypothetical protein